MSLRLTILGCGSSGGVPRVGQGWGACDPAEPRNRRRRCSVLLERESGAGKTTVLVDTSPDLREQLIDQEVTRLDAILMTHAHADHLHGLDDIRPLTMIMRRLIPIYMDEPTGRDVREKFGYILETPPGSPYPPLVEPYPLTPGEAVTIDGAGGPIDALPVLFRHGDIDALGFRFGDTLYSPDLSDIPAESTGALEGLDLWIIDALRYTPHPTHITVARALELVAKYGCRRAVLTNLHTDIDFATLSSKVPGNVSLAYDGLTLELVRR